MTKAVVTSRTPRSHLTEMARGALVIVAFLGIVLAVPLIVAHLVERPSRFRIDMPD